MFAVPFREAKNGTSFGIEQMRDLVWSNLRLEQKPPPPHLLAALA